MVWQGLTAKSVRHHYSLVPLYVATGIGAAMAAYYVFRLTQGVDASWRRNSNPHPWNNIPANHRQKFLGAGRLKFEEMKKNGPQV